MLDFLISNWRWIAVVLIELISFIILLLKKRITIQDSKYREILLKIPGLISQAEKLSPSGNGKEKFDFVFVTVIDLLKSEYGDSLTKMFSDTVSSFIESILECPQKKMIKVKEDDYE